MGARRFRFLNTRLSRWLRVGLPTIPILAFGFLNPSVAENCLVLSDLGATSPGTIAIQNNLYQALDRSGICYEPVSLPPRRSTSELLAGGIDGETVRIREYLDRVGVAAVRVKEPMTDLTGVLVKRDKTTQSLEDAKGLTIGSMRGIFWSDRTAENMNNVIFTDSIEQLVKMFLRERIDGFLVFQNSIAHDQRLAGFQQLEVYQTTTHVYMHESRAEMAPLVSETIRIHKEMGFDFISLEDQEPQAAQQKLGSKPNS